MKYVLTLDQGTTSSRAIIFDKNGQIKGEAHQEFSQFYPNLGWVEHDPNEIFASQMSAITTAMIRANVSLKDIDSIGITNQRETTVCWDKSTGEPVYNAIVWQCRRTADYCNDLIKKGYSDMVFEKTGLIIDSYFSATKIKWILDNVNGAREKAEKGDLLFGTIDTFLMWKMSNGKIFATDYTNASRTMLFNIHELKWDEELINLFGIPKSMLPSVYPSGHFYGYTSEDVLRVKLPITGVCGDQQSALFGHLCTEKGDLKTTYGTGCFILFNNGKDKIKAKTGLLTTLSACLEKEKPNYCLEGSVFIGGAVIQWLKDGLKLISTPMETDELAKKVKDTNGVYVVPAFTGLGAPYWDSNATGTITGITRGTQKEHVVRACLEAIAYQVKDIIDLIKNELGIKIKKINVDGGASKGDFLMQFQSNLLDSPLFRPEVTETTALGVCYLAGLTTGYFNSLEDIKKTKSGGKTFLPDMSEKERNSLVLGWKKAVDKARL